MNIRLLAAVFGLSAVMALAVACGNGEAAVTPDAGLANTSPAAAVSPSAPAEASEPAAVAQPADEGVQASVPTEAVVNPVTAPRSASPSLNTAVAQVGASGNPSAQLQAVSSQAGIWVTGAGSIALEPDLALINIGVETTAPTVRGARDQAATAMAAIVAAVEAHGLTDKDIQTRSFNIWPQYSYEERTRVLIGYMVSNTATIKVRDIDGLGVIIDDVADAGGDATRINGISFTVEDPTPFMTQLREDAVNDALAKAQQFADLTGVTLGRLAYISEVGAGAPVQQVFAERAVALAAPAADTSISGGELELTLRVQAGFAIQ